MSVVARGGSFISPYDGRIAALTGTGISSGITNLGQVSKYDGTSGQYATLSVPALGLQQPFVFAAIVMVRALSGFHSNILSNSSSGTYYRMGINGGLTVFLEGSVTGKVSTTAAISLNTPYFLCATTGTTTSTIIVIKNLSSGSVIAEVLANTQGHNGDGTALIGRATNGHTVDYAAAMISNRGTLSLPEALKWADDPWSFWYPDRNNMWISAGAVWPPVDQDNAPEKLRVNQSNLRW